MTKMRWLWLVVGIVLLGACGTQAPPPPPPAAEPAAGPMQQPPVFALIGARERLELTSEQISALDSIGRWNSSANETAIRQLRDQDPRTRRPGDPETDSLVRSIRQNNQQAARAVRDLLTDEQRREVCEMFKPTERRDARASQRREQSRPRTRRPGDPPTMGEERPRSVWPWCEEAARDTSSLRGPAGATSG